MKNKLIILICSCFIFISCEDYFSPTLKGTIPEEDFFSQLNNLRYGLNAVYNHMQTERYQRGDIIFGEALSDNVWNAQDVETSDVADILNFTFNTENSYILERYQCNYQGINKANQVIRSVHKVYYRATGAPEKEIREIYGQAKLLRALFYFNLVKTFGGVPIRPEEELELNDLIIPRSSIDEVYAYIEKELRESLLLLRRQAYIKGECGQAGIGAGLGLLMKVLLYQGSPGTQLKETDKEQKLQEALEIGKYFIAGEDIKLTDLVKFERYAGKESWEDFSERLFLDKVTMNQNTVFRGQDIVNLHAMDNFDNLFRVSGEFSTESLLEINHYDYSGTGVSIDEGWKCSGYYTGNWMTPTKALAELFKNDPRQIFVMMINNVYNDYFTQEESAPFGNFNGTGDQNVFTKYYVFPSEGGAQARNYRIMRYTEVLLIWAEILNETGNTPQAVDVLNRVRERARKLFTGENGKYITKANILPINFKNVDYAPYDIIRERILEEKRREMAGDGDRWFEINRLGITSVTMKSLYTAALQTPEGNSNIPRIRGKYFKKGVNEIFPIPQKEVFISNGVIKQNFGY